MTLGSILAFTGFTMLFATFFIPYFQKRHLDNTIPNNTFAHYRKSREIGINRLKLAIITVVIFIIHYIYSIKCYTNY